MVWAPRAVDWTTPTVGRPKPSVAKLVAGGVLSPSSFLLKWPGQYSSIAANSSVGLSVGYSAASQLRAAGTAVRICGVKAGPSSACASSNRLGRCSDGGAATS